MSSTLYEILLLYTCIAIGKMELLKLLDRKRIFLNLDATGSLISKPPCCSNKIFYYALTIQHPEFSTSPIPLAEMISSDHSTAEISHFLNKWCLSVKLFKNTDLKVKKVEIDFSWALIHSTCLAFNKFTILSYLQNCWEYIHNNKNLIESTTVLHLCSAHIMHRISYNLGKKFLIEKQLKRIILHAFGRMVNCNQMDEIDQIFGLLCYILCCKKQTSAYCNMLNQLEEWVKGDITITSNAPEEFESDTDVHVNGVTYREKSPFGRHFELVYINTLNTLSEMENVSQSNSPNSISYSPQIIQFLLTYYMPLLPLWSGIILSTVNSEASSTDSNAIAENWFRIVKHSIFNSETNIKAADFIRRIYPNIEDRIAAFKFAFTPLAHKLFKRKKRVRVENEEECKEEWSRSKKSKFSYIKPTIDKVSQVFFSLKSRKNSNTEVLSNESIVKKELSMIVEKSTGSSTIMDNSLSEQTVKVNENNLQEVKDVEIISDLDLVEVATLEYKLPRYQPLTYRGQTILCQDLGINF